MKVILSGPKSASLAPRLPAYGLALVHDAPDAVICYGGDGTVFRAERAYPGVPKLLLRDSAICKLCSKLSNEEVLARIRDSRYEIRAYPKLKARASGKMLTGMNDIIVHNADPRHGIRYILIVNGEPVGHEIVGDGIVAATPLGSTGYYRSITDSFFSVGIGIAFNNSTEQSDHMVVGDENVIKLSIIRGPAVVYADNHPESIPLGAGEDVEITKSADVARMILPLP